MNNPVQLAVRDGPQQRRAFDQVVARFRKNPALRQARDRMARSADALQEGRDAVRRSDLADQIDSPNVDAELERRGRDQRFQVASLQARFRSKPFFLRQAAVMCGYRCLAEAFAQLMRNPLGHPPGVHENQRGAVLMNQLGQAVVILRPHLVRHHRVERRTRNLEGQVHLTAMPRVDDRAVAGRAAGEKLRHVLDRLLRCGQADPLQRPSGHLLQPLQRDCEVRAAPGSDHRVDFVDDHRPRALQHRPTAFRGQQQVERFGSCDQNVRRRFQHCRALRRWRVAGPHRRGDPRRLEALSFGDSPDPPARLGQILVDVRTERFQWRDIDHSNFVRQRLRETLAQQIVERNQKRRQRFAGSSRRRDQAVAAVANRLPAALLRLRW